MSVHKKVKPFPVAVKKVEGTSEPAASSSMVFQHRELIENLPNSKTIDSKKLINIINHLHFTGGFVSVHLKDAKYEEDFLVRARPEPCMDSAITCRWASEGTFDAARHRMQNLLIPDGQSVICVPISVRDVNEGSFTIDIPERVFSAGKRRIKRYDCSDISVELLQSGFSAQGVLVDFSPLAFRVHLVPQEPSSFHWFDNDNEVTVRLYQDKIVIFSGTCRVTRQTDGHLARDMVLVPAALQIQRHKKRKVRNPRIRLSPSPYITFDHPFFGKQIKRDIYDISTTGFSVHEATDESVLMPGLIIPELTISFPGSLRLQCTAQVVYRREMKRSGVRCGFVILDMNVGTYNLFSNILVHAIDPHVHISDTIDMNALWEFFFDTGFIYPKKYQSLQSYRTEFKKIYERLYNRESEVATHFTYQRSGKIYGHVSMVRAYERAWLVHHLAARPILPFTKHTGVHVIKQLMNYLSGLHLFHSVRMNHTMFYYQPKNRFMDMFFGAFVRDTGNPRICSLDLFAYKNFKQQPARKELPPEWTLREFVPSDMNEIERFYRHHSGGLLLSCLDLENYGGGNGDSIEKLYKRHGLIRRWKAFSLLKGDRHAALMIVNRSDLGLNLSELLNGVKIIITEPADTPWDILSTAAQALIEKCHVENPALTIFPHSYLEKGEIPYEKQYLLWIINSQYGRDFIEYMRERLKTNARIFIKLIMEKFFR